DVHVVTGVVKSYLRSIEPLCTFEKYDTFMKAVAAPEWRQKMIAVQDAIHALPRSSFITLKFICDHLKRVSEREVENRMSVRNLSIVFAPNLLR
ncbi:Rho GTPase-activating protein domain-containing protein, partial [Zopfochytrium polystomum]